MNPADTVPFALLLLFLTVFLGGVVLLGFATRWHRLALAKLPPPFREGESPQPLEQTVEDDEHFFERPKLWIAVRHPDAAGVFQALGLENPQPGHWTDCAPGSGRMFVSVPINGWTILVGDGLPDPVEDIDRCFRFLSNLSIALGHVQLFLADAVLNHQAWACLESGHVVRGYAWAGETLWSQGEMTSAEKELDLKCLGYGQDSDPLDWRLRDRVMENIAKLPRLAARWSFDPAALERVPAARVRGVAGYAGSIHA